MKKIKTSGGFTLAELLIGVILTGLITTAGFKFYVSMHNSSISQQEVTDIQQTSRACLDDISKTLRMAGYKIGSHIPYLVNGDSLYVFFNGSQPVDTVLYFLENYTKAELHYLDDFPQGFVPRKLMKKVNSSNPDKFAGMINDITYTVHSPSRVEILIDVQSSKADEDFASTSGYRMYSTGETISIRNLNL
jgi:type II secretory pathway pseudopilin PulG